MLTIHKTSRVYLLIFACVLLLLGIGLEADPEAERAALLRLVKELDRLELLVDRAERERDTEANIRFRYDWLRSDLDKVKSGVNDYVNRTQLEPISIESIRGNYQ